MKVKKVFADQGVHIQELSYSCGPCTILNALHLKGDFSRNEQELAKLCEAKPGVGSSNQNVLKVCEQVGLKVLESKSDASIKDIERNLDAGAYVIVNYIHAYSGHGHYSLVTEYDDKAVYLMDSSYGLIRLDKKDFDKYWYNSNKTIKRWYAAVE